MNVRCVPTSSTVAASAELGDFRDRSFRCLPAWPPDASARSEAAPRRSRWGAAEQPAPTQAAQPNVEVEIQGCLPAFAWDSLNVS